MNELFGITLYDYQQKFLYDCLKKPRVLGCFARQTGKSMTIAIASAMAALRLPNGHIVLCAPTDRQAGELFMKITTFLSESKIKGEVKSITQRSAIMNNGCRITALPCGDDGSNIRGMTADLLIIEEAAFIKDKIMAEVLMPMVAATHGNIIKISTPFGMNHFYKSYQANDWDIHHIDYHEAIKVGHYTQEFINEQKTQYGETSIGFRTEYGAEFIADQDNYFGYELIETCVSDYKPLFLPTQGKQYYLGADIARFGTDSTVLTVVEKGSEMLPHKVVQIKELHGLPVDEVIEEIFALHKVFHFNKIYTDETGLGAGVTDVLRQRLGERNKAKFATSAKQYDYQDIVVGVTFTIKSKVDIFSNLRVLMEQGRLIIPNNKKLVYQLKDFRYERTESGNMKLHHSDGGHDDFCFVEGTKILTKKGQKNIEDISIGELVMTRKGYRKVIGAGNRIKEVINNCGLTGTADHPIITKKGIVKLINVNESDILYIWNEKQSSIMEGSIIDIQSQREDTLENTIGHITPIQNPHRYYTETYGKISLVKYLKEWLFTIKTVIQKIMRLQIWKLCQEENISQNIVKAKKEELSQEKILLKQLKRQKSGMDQKQEWSGIMNIIKIHWLRLRNMFTNVSFAIRNMGLQESLQPSIVQSPVREGVGGKKILRSVYNISVEENNEYFANNILVHNCDSLALAVRGINVQGYVLDW